MSQEEEQAPLPCCCAVYFDDYQVPEKNFEVQLDEYRRLMEYHNYLMEGWVQAMEYARENCCCVTTTPILPVAPMCPAIPTFLRYSGVFLLKDPTFGGNANVNMISTGQIYPWGGIMTVNGIRSDYQLCWPRPQPPDEPEEEPRARILKYTPCPEPANVDNPCPAPWDYPEPIGPQLPDPDVKQEDDE